MPDAGIPYEDFGGSGENLHFAHANGYPPQAYRPLLNLLSERYHVFAMRMRPLWEDSSPEDFHDWRVLAEDLRRFMDMHSSQPWIAIGHSMGANATLRMALFHPERFKGLVLIDPVLFPPFMSWIWKAIYELGFAYRIHPLARAAQKRRRSFENRVEMYNNYRQKAIFSRLNDEALEAYVDSLACDCQDGKLELCYPADWEARIYVTGLKADREIWERLSTLQPPLLIIRGALTDTFLELTARRVSRKLPNSRIVSIPDTTHLVPLEQPKEVSRLIQSFLASLSGKPILGDHTSLLQENV